MDYEKNMRNLLVPKYQNVEKNPKAIGLSSFNPNSRISFLKQTTMYYKVLQSFVQEMYFVPKCYKILQ